MSELNDKDLYACIECGHVVSRHAHGCPNCHTEHPGGIECVICGVVEPAVRLVKGGKHSGRGEAARVVQVFYHDTCRTNNITLPVVEISCPDCHSVFDGVRVEKFRNNWQCPECGAKRWPLHKGASIANQGECDNCGIDVILPFHATSILGGRYHEACKLKLEKAAQTKKINSGCLGVLLLTLIVFASIAIRLA